MSEKVTIAMAIYHPDLKWLEEQLASLEQQTYKDCFLDILDDGPDAPVGEAFFGERLRSLAYRYRINEKNIGTNATFSQLIKDARGEFIAFCDQDDRWKFNKVERLLQEFSDERIQAAYCLLSVIDERGAAVAADVRDVRRGDRFICGEDIAEQLLVRNSIYGCSLMIRSKTAKEALPLPEKMNYDHWTSLWASVCGHIALCENALIEYRIHGNNQSTPLRGIRSKAAYEEQRINKIMIQMISCRNWLTEKKELSLGAWHLKSRVCEVLRWSEARKDWFHGKGGAFIEFCRGRKYSPRAFLFELFLPFVPERFLVSTIWRKN